MREQVECSTTGYVERTPRFQVPRFMQKASEQSAAAEALPRMAPFAYHSAPRLFAASALAHAAARTGLQVLHVALRSFAERSWHRLSGWPLRRSQHWLHWEVEDPQLHSSRAWGNW
jgi:hypothetical protein